MLSFAAITARAEERKGGVEALNELMPILPPPSHLAALADNHILGEMTKRIFCSGFVWSVIEKKWPGFEEAFLEFDPNRLLHQPPDFWDALTSNPRIVRNGQKIMSVIHNARFVADIAVEHGSFGRFLAQWPESDQIGLLDLMSKRGSRLGSNTGQFFLRSIGKDGFVLTRDVILCLRNAGLDIADPPTSKKDLVKIQAQFNDWADETGLPYTHLSRICAMSIGENLPAERLKKYGSE